VLISACTIRSFGDERSGDNLFYLLLLRKSTAQLLRSEAFARKREESEQEQQEAQQSLSSWYTLKRFSTLIAFVCPGW
jgi:hypothetical protein